MRFRSVASILLALLLGSTSAGQSKDSKPGGSVSGRVTVGGEPVRGVAVMMIAADDYAQRSAVARATTDDGGYFRLTGVPAGRFSVQAFAPAMIGPSEVNYGQPGKLINVAPGENVEGMNLSLSRGGVITGRVVDSSGRPLISQNVWPVGIDERGQKFNAPGSRFSQYQTDDRGIYRVFGLAAGRYLVRVGETPGEGSVYTGRGAYYVLTFHPGVTDEASAAMVELAAGEEVGNIDITVGRAAKTYSAAGKIIDGEIGKPVPGLLFGYGSLAKDGNYMSGMRTTGARSDTQGRFQIDGLSPGRYGVFVLNEQGSTQYGDTTLFEVADGDVKGLEVKMHSAGAISGVAVLEGAADADSSKRLAGLILYASVFKQDELRVPISIVSTIGVDGGFHFTRLQPGTAHLRLDQRATNQGMALVRVERDGLEQTAPAIEVGPGENVTGIKVVISRATGVIRGQVRIEGGSVPEGARFSVSYIRQGKLTISSSPVETDERNRFIIEKLAPGDYDLLLVLRWLTPRPGVPPPQIPPTRQTVTVSNDVETEVTIVLDLSAKQKTTTGKPDSIPDGN